MTRLPLFLGALLACGVTLAQTPTTAPSQSSQASQSSQPSLIPNGDFETDKDANGAPDGWPSAGPTIAWQNEGGNHYLRLQVAEPRKPAMVYRSLDLKPEDKAFEFSFRVRYDGIKPGAQPWFDGRIMVNFKDDQKKTVKGGPGHPNFRGSNAQWQQKTIRFTVPEGAKVLEIMPTLFQAEAGTLDLDDLRLVRIDPAAVPAK